MSTTLFASRSHPRPRISLFLFLSAQILLAKNLPPDSFDREAPSVLDEHKIEIAKAS